MITKDYAMEQVTVNAKYGIQLPSALRRRMNIKIGQKMLIEEKNNHLELTPDINFTDLKGILSGINTNINRESDRL